MNLEERAKSYVGKLVAGRYRLSALLGLGGMSAVYQAADQEGKPFALKILYPELMDGEAAQRFERESKLVLGLSHPHVVATLAAGRDDTGSDEQLGLPYLIMELLHGTDLSTVMNKEGALDPQVAVRLVLQSASGVAAAHTCGLVHRDIKPASLFLQTDDVSQTVTVKVCDFGVARSTRVTEANSNVPHLSLSRTGGMLGSPRYKSPEQTENVEAGDERTDVWSLSAVLWEALSGERLWGAQTSLGELVVAIRTEPIPQLGVVAPWVPPDLARVVHRGLERDPNLRLSSVRAFIEALSAFSGGSDRVQNAQLVAMTSAERGALQLKVNISASAAAAMANLARGGRGGTSLPPEREAIKRSSTRPRRSVTNSWLMVFVLVVVVGGLSVLLGYLMHKP